LMLKFFGSLMKNDHCISTKQHGAMKSGITWSKNSTILQAVFAGAMSCWKMWKLSYPHSCVKVIKNDQLQISCIWAFLWLQW